MAVGFDLDASVPFFRIQNSWGASWGEKGFFRMAIGKGKGYCGLSGHTWNYFPVVEW